MWQQWFKINWQAFQCKVSSRAIIYGKEGFRFYILPGLKSFTKFRNGNLSVKGSGDEVEYYIVKIVKFCWEIRNLLADDPLARRVL